MAIVHDDVDFKVGPVTAADKERATNTGSWDYFEGRVIEDEDGTEIGMEEHCREVYYAMRVRYMRRETDLIQGIEDEQFKLNYSL